MGQHALDLAQIHAPDEAGADRDEGVVARRSGGEGVDLVALVDADFGHLDAGLLGLLGNLGDEPFLGLAARAVDHLDAVGHLGHPLGDREGDEAAGEAHDHREDEQGLVVDAAAGQEAVDAEQARHDGDHQDHREVRQQKQEYTFHGSLELSASPVLQRARRVCVREEGHTGTRTVQVEILEGLSMRRQGGARTQISSTVSNLARLRALLGPTHTASTRRTQPMAG